MESNSLLSYFKMTEEINQEFMKRFKEADRELIKEAQVEKVDEEIDMEYQEKCICNEGIHNQGEFDCACECHKKEGIENGKTE